MAKVRHCICCGTKYRYCPTCGSEDKFKPAWYSEFCCEDCKDIWETATKYNMELVSKEEAQKKIAAIDLKPREQYAECVQRDLKTIMGEEPKVAVKAAVEEAPKIAKKIVK